MQDYGVFNDDGELFDGPHFSSSDAEEALSELSEDHEGLHVGQVCRDHEDQEDGYCSICNDEN